MRDREHMGMRRRRDSERGQATVEFALILFPFLILVGGIIWFGIGLNYWLDMQRIANQGARWAAVNNWPPDCLRGTQIPPGCPSPNTLQETLERQAIAGGLEDSVTAQVCYPSAGSKNVGDPVRVRLSAPFTLFWVTDSFQLELVAEATMRLEQKPTLISGEVTVNAQGCQWAP